MVLYLCLNANIDIHDIVKLQRSLVDLAAATFFGGHWSPAICSVLLPHLFKESVCLRFY